ncbi:hypothetical protein ZWY2020_057404 [Hordeum vulgare]|nr:hypothetical protein ZWY2020_057403 [Hordeum vulgare]KAI4992519.1 hypothetical protein ZWY2020_057404 [Hordeum vulgare]
MLARGGVLFALAGSPYPALGSPERVPPPPLDLVMSALTPEAALSTARGEDSPVVSARENVRLNQSRLLLDGRVPTIQEKATLRVAARDLSPEMATDSGIVFRGEKGAILEQISAICTKEKLEGSLAEARANAARGEPSSQETTDPGHRETKGGAAPLLVIVAGTSWLAPSPLRVPCPPPHASQPPRSTVTSCVGLAPGPPP